MEAPIFLSVLLCLTLCLTLPSFVKFAVQTVGYAGLGSHVKMGVQVHGRLDVLVPQPDLYVLQVKPEVLQVARRRVAQIVEAYPGQPVLPQQKDKMVADIVGLNRLAVRVSTYIVAVEIVVGLRFPILALLVPPFKQFFPDFARQRENCVAAVVLCPIFPVYPHGCRDNGVPDGQRVVLKINRTPSQT